MNYLARLHALKAEKCSKAEPTKLPKPSFVGFVSDPDRPISEELSANPIQSPTSCPAEWPVALAALDPSRPLDGIDPVRWQVLLADARWLARNHGAAAAALGWRAGDLFGLDPMHPGWSGLADRLDGARQVVLTDAVAHWQGEDEEGWVWRKSLRPMPPIWASGGSGNG